MIQLPRPHMYRAIFILLCASILGAACVTSASDDTAGSDWQDYYDTASGFSFSYPPGWEVVDAFLYKGKYVATIQMVGGENDTNNWIRINSPQFMEEDGRCIETNKQRICTYSRDTEVLEIFEQISASFTRNRVNNGEQKTKSDAEWYEWEEKE